MANKTAIYKEITREYERIRDISSAELRDKQAYVYSKCPEISDIELQMRLTGVKIARLIIEKPSDSISLTGALQEELTLLKKRKIELLASLGLECDFLTIKYKCSKCKDTGYIENLKCSCFQQKLVDKAYGQSNIRDVLKTENFDFFDIRFYNTEPDASEGISPRDNIQRIFKICMNFTQNFNIDFSNLLLYGSTGLGKTFLCNCIAKELLDTGKTVMYVTASQLFKIIEDDRFNRGDNEEPSGYMDDILSVDLFIIDDLGTEFSTILSSSELFNILNTRMLNKKPVILSTNLAPSDFINQYSDRIVSRIMGNYSSLKFFGDDIRIKKKFKK